MLFTHVFAFCERSKVGDAVKLGEQRVDARQRELRRGRGEPARRFVKAEGRSTTQTNALDLLLAGRRRRRGGRRRWRLEPRRDRLVRHVGSHELRRWRRRPPANCRKARRKYARRTYYRTPEAARHPLQFPRPAALRVRLRRTASADESYKNDAAGARAIDAVAGFGGGGGPRRRPRSLPRLSLLLRPPPPMGTKDSRASEKTN